MNREGGLNPTPVNNNRDQPGTVVPTPESERPMTTRSKITTTVVTIWAAAVGALVWWYHQHPTMVEYDHAVRDTGNPFADRYLPTFPRADFGTAVLIATGIAAVVILIATVWTKPQPTTTTDRTPTP